MSMIPVGPIAGYASLFNVADRNGDIVSKGAFRRAVRKPRFDGVKMLYQHAPGIPVGRWTRFEEDHRGLWAEGELLLSTEAGREAYDLLKGGAISGLSIGFNIGKAERFGRRRRIVEADLWEISIVTFPAAPGARVVYVDPPDEAPPSEIFRELIAEASLADALRGAAQILRSS
jgi:hypothetical protein